jgi:hypothetical protein
MARVLPAEPVSKSSGELKVRSALAGLGPGWTVLHGVAWQGVRSGRQSDGEADFVLVHPSHGLLIVEVKGGGIEVDEGVWYSTDRRGERHQIKDPFAQATESKHSLIAFLRSRKMVDGFVSAGHAVAFPDIAGIPSLGPAAPAEIVWTRGDLQHMAAAVDATVRHWDLMPWGTADDAARVVSALAPTVAARPLLRDQVDASIEELIRLTDEQVRTLDALRRNRRSMVYGGAGTGKTVLAVERARRLADDGARVLLTCFNRPLGDHLASITADDDQIYASSFHALCFAQARAAGFELPASPSAAWFDEDLPALLPESAERNGNQFDAVVVDEAQDFAPSWWTYLAMLLVDPDDGPFHVFLDSNQSIFRQDWEPPFDAASFDLSINCRSTLPILDRVAGFTGAELASSSGADGPSPRLDIIDGFGDIGNALRSALHRLLVQERLSASQIVLLSTSKDVVEEMRRRKIGPHQLVPPGGDGIVAETVHRFKGLESDAVVLVCPDLNDDSDRLLYVGLTRARAYLEVICTDDVAQRLHWPR